MLRREYSGWTRDEFLWGYTVPQIWRFLAARNRYVQEYNAQLDTGSGNTGGGKMTLAEAETELANARPVTLEEVRRGLFG